FGKFTRQAEFADDGESIDARVAALAEHLDDYRFAGANVRREFDHLNYDFVVRRSGLRAGIHHAHRLRENFAIDFDIARAAALFIDADKLMRVALQNGDDLARLT